MNHQQRTSLKITSKLHTNYICPFAQCGRKFKNNSLYNHHLTLHSQQTKFCSKCNKIFSNSESYDDHLTTSQHKQRNLQEMSLFFENNQPLTSTETEIFQDYSVDTVTDSDTDFLEDTNFLIKVLQTTYQHLQSIPSHEVVAHLHTQKSHHYPYSNTCNSFLASWFHRTNTSQEMATELLQYLNKNSNLDVVSSFDLLLQQEQAAPTLVTLCKLNNQ